MATINLQCNGFSQNPCKCLLQAKNSMTGRAVLIQVLLKNKCTKKLPGFMQAPASPRKNVR